MSLTNPNKVITEERLSSFYQDILPYLGGMPEILANKFSRGDIYSTEEKMIGCWIDGKPLYQKVIQLSNEETYSDLGWVSIVEAPINADSLRNIITLLNDSVRTIPLPFLLRDGYLKYYKDSTFNLPSSLKTNIFILQYTKTTDSPISIGSDTDYSTDEKIVGKWIDGSYIYQKTINFGALPNATSKGVNHSISNLDKIVSIMGVAYSSSYPAVPLPYSSTVDNENIALLVTPTQVQIVAGINRTSLSAYITLQYTKTS